MAVTHLQVIAVVVVVLVTAWLTYGVIASQLWFVFANV